MAVLPQPMRRLSEALVVSAAIGIYSPAYAASETGRAELQSSQAGTALQISLPAGARHKVFSLNDPGRWVIDLDNVTAGSALQALAAPDRKLPPEVAAVRVGRRSADAVRVVVEFKDRAPEAQTSIEPANAEKRLVLRWQSAANRASLPPATMKLAQSQTTMRDVPPIDAVGGTDYGAGNGVRPTSWKFGTSPGLSYLRYSSDSPRRYATNVGGFIDADYQERFGLTLGTSHSNVGYRNGTPDLNQNSHYLSGRATLVPGNLPGRVTLRLDAHHVSNNDTTNETNGVGVIAPRVGYTSADKSFYADLGYAHSRYGDSNIGNGSLTVNQFTPTLGIGFNQNREWLQLRAYNVRYSNSLRAQGQDQTNSLEAKLTHYMTPAGWVPEQINASLLVGHRLYGVDGDTAIVYNQGDMQRGGASLGASWKIGREARLTLSGGADSYQSQSAGVATTYYGAYVYTGVSASW